MTDDSDDNVLKFVLFHQRCQHNKFIIDDSLDRVFCGICNQALNPMWVLGELCGNEHRAAQRLRQLNELAEKAEKSCASSAVTATK